MSGDIALLVVSYPNSCCLSALHPEHDIMMRSTRLTRKSCSNGHGLYAAFPTPYWIGFYLSDRQHQVSIHRGVHFQSIKPDKDVPQGSALDPLHFFTFTTPVGDLIKSFGNSYHHCADDTQLYVTIDWRAANGFSEMSACANAVTWMGP